MNVVTRSFLLSLSYLDLCFFVSFITLGTRILCMLYAILKFLIEILESYFQWSLKSCSNSMDYVIPMLVVSPELNSCWKFLLLCVHILLDFGIFVTIVSRACVYILLSSKMEN
jgi:hypothetical protein